MEIRHYQQADHDAVWALHKVALQDTGADLGDGPWNDDLAQIEQIYLNQQGEFLVGVIEKHIVAMGALRRTTTERAEITRMRVHPDFQRRGFGQMILTALESRAIELGYKELHLHTTMLQEAALQLYRKNGFKQLAETTMIQNKTVIFFEKAL